MVNRNRIAFVAALVSVVVACSGCESALESDTPAEADTPASITAAPRKAPPPAKSVADFGPWLHDPSTMWFDNGYFMVLSSGYRTDYESRKSIQGLGIDMWYRDAQSTEWKHAQNIFTGDEKPKWWAQILNEGTFWAPDAPSKNVMYYSFEADDDSSSVIARAVAGGTAPNLKWKDDGIVVLFPNCRDEGVTCPVAIDPSVFSDDEGGMYLTFGSGTSGIWIAELDSATGHLTDEAAKGWSEDNPAWHHVAYRDTVEDYIEAAYSFRHPTNGYYYLFVNWGGCCRGIRSTYNIRVGRSESPTGPYLDKDRIDLVDQGGSLVLETEGRYIGPGHASIYRHTDGRFVFTFHYYDGEDAGKARMAARILNWVDDWPVVTDTDFFETPMQTRAAGTEAPGTGASKQDMADTMTKEDLTVTPKGNRLLHIDISPSEELDEVDARSLARSRAGINAALVGGSWPELETAPGRFNYRGLKSADSTYKDVKVVLELNPIETYIRTVPSDLQTVPFDDPVMIARFKKLLDVVFSQLSDLQITALWIGNEVTGYLDKSGEWDAYQTFYETVGAYAKEIRPGIKVGSAGSMDDWNNIAESEFKKAKALNQTSDIIVFTCYPTPGNVKNAFDTLTSEFAGKPIYIKEIGCPTSSRIGSSEETQKQFVKEVFRAWDEHASQIEYVSFHPLHDFPEELVTGLFALMGMSEDEDVSLNMEIMTSIGLRTYPGKGQDKLGFRALIKEAKARGW